MLRTLYTMLRLDLRLYQKKRTRSLSLYRSRSIASESIQSLASSSSPLLSPPVKSSTTVWTSASLPQEISYDALTKLKRNRWRNFVVGTFTLILPLVKPALAKQYPGLKEGAYLGMVGLIIGIAWGLLSGLDVWSKDLSLDFPLDASPTGYNSHLVTSYLQAAYVVVSNALMSLAVYKFIFFLLFLPSSRPPHFSRPMGSKFHYRFDFPSLIQLNA